MDKKAALELSVNAIVILIMAIAVLGLALGFIRSQFKKFDFPVETPEPATPSSETPITYTLATQSVSAGDYLHMRVKIMNTNIGPINNAVPNMTCLSPILNGFQAAPKTIAGKEVGSYEFSVRISKSAGKDTYICGLASTPSVNFSTDVRFDVK
jgi:hypothetical protein